MTTESTSHNPTGELGGTGPGAADDTATSYGTGPFYAPLCRASDGQILGGVAAGLARYLDFDVSIIRIAIVVLALLGGAGIPLYIAGWLLIPEEGTGRTVLTDLLHPEAAL
jgi:phage shock protein PspC (stress-responsive transcriptional regulator)